MIYDDHGEYKTSIGLPQEEYDKMMDSTMYQLVKKVCPHLVQDFHVGEKTVRVYNDGSIRDAPPCNRPILYGDGRGIT